MVKERQKRIIRDKKLSVDYFNKVRKDFQTRTNKLKSEMNRQYKSLSNMNFQGVQEFEEELEKLGEIDKFKQNQIKKLKDSKKQSKRIEYWQKEAKTAFNDIQTKDYEEENETKWNTIEGALLKSNNPKKFYFQFN